MHHLPEIQMYNVIFKMNKKNRTSEFLQTYILYQTLSMLVKKSNFYRHFEDGLVHPSARQGWLFLLKKLIERCFDSYIPG